MPSLEVMRYRMLMAQRQSFGNRPYPHHRRPGRLGRSGLRAGRVASRSTAVALPAFG